MAASALSIPWTFIHTKVAGSSTSEGEGKFAEKYYYCPEDGEYKFEMEARKTSGGTGYAERVILTAQITGKATNTFGPT